MIIPAIDLINGNVVRLHKGCYKKQSNYNNNPKIYLKEYLQQGAKELHLIDLTGARYPTKRQNNLIIQLLNYISPVTIQIGGGIRSSKDIEILLNSGATRVIFGSTAIEQPKMVRNWFEYFGPEVLVLAVDIRINQEGKRKVAINGWQNDSNITLEEIIKEYHSLGLKHVLCTDINRDGTLEGNNIPLYRYICKKWPDIDFQASGGTCNLSDIKKLRQSGVKRIIIGRALLEKRFTVKEAIQCWQKE